MSAAFVAARARLAAAPAVWAVTGVAGFIGSHLAQALLELGQSVVGLDNFATGHRRNLDEVAAAVGPAAWARFALIEGDICDPATCARAVAGVDYVLHQAALGSVPRSLADPQASHAANVTGTLNVLVAARDAGVRRLVYAASSASYGDHPDLPKVEGRIGAPLSPYAVTKRVGELYAEVFARCYGFKAIGLRYFNVFGPRQDPEGAYAAVIPAWTRAALAGEPVWINGDGLTSRDFTPVDNVVQANLLAALAPEAPEARVYNIACGARTTLLELHGRIVASLGALGHPVDPVPRHRAARPGDVAHSLADIGAAVAELGYAPGLGLAAGLDAAMPWYVRHLRCG